MSDTEKLDALARFGLQVIEAQLMLASRDIKDAIGDYWVLGYCFGVFDAISQRAKLDQYTDGLATITIGFILLLGDHNIAAGYVGRVINNQENKTIQEGIISGGSDVMNFLSAESKTPMSLFTYVRLI